ncbi:MAG: NUDIX domain-containing protein [Gaiellaceae bacterium]|jgi:predicted NUDIX family NTP pyrophosphohydrolase
MKTSAGILLYREGESGLEVLIAHMGGPFWRGKDARAWSIPKGELEAGEEPLAVARREFEEELGSAPPHGSYLELGELKQSSAKRVIVFALRGDLDVETVHSNSFSLEWPKGSGRIREFPEIDRAAWVSPETAAEKLVLGQVQFLERLRQALARAG